MIWRAEEVFLYNSRYSLLIEWEVSVIELIMSLAYLLDLILYFQACVRAVTGDYFLLSIDHLVYKPKVTSSNRQRKGQKPESLYLL